MLTVPKLRGTRLADCPKATPGSTRKVHTVRIRIKLAETDPYGYAAIGAHGAGVAGVLV
jgi:hypothetical protein